ncbi:MAG: hypothetical protein HOV79_22620 [Hamadaea sp.]|nr:hypothetical protein [Hamadaea sp.]
MNDDLFRPTIAARPTAVGEPPWRPDSIIYPAIFGGPLAATVLGTLNARRLGLGRNVQLAVIAVGLACIVARVVATSSVTGLAGGRILGSIAGAVVWGMVILTQKKAFRAYQYGGGEPSSLVGPGIGAALGCGIVEAVLIAGVS